MRRTFMPTARQTNVLLIVGFAAAGYGLYFRYLVVEQSAVGLACQGGLQTWLCFTRALLIPMFTHGVFGIVALAAALLHFLRPSLLLFAIALAAGGFGIVAYNVVLSSLAAGLLILSLARPAPASGTI